MDQTYDLMSHNATVLQCDDLDEFMYVHWTNDAKEQGIIDRGENLLLRSKAKTHCSGTLTSSRSNASMEGELALQAPESMHASRWRAASRNCEFLSGSDGTP